jgi:hypothetical protein
LATVRQSFLDLEAILVGEDSQAIELFLSRPSQMSQRNIAKIASSESNGKIMKLFLDCLKVDSLHHELCHFVFTQLCMFFHVYSVIIARKSNMMTIL